MENEKTLEVITARRTESLDANSIQKLVTSSTTDIFGRTNIVNLIEKAVLAVTLCNEQDAVLGHAAFFDYPNVEAVKHGEWEKWLVDSGYDLALMDKCSATNTLFMHYFVSKAEYSMGCAQEIMRTVFNAIVELHYIFLVVPMGVYPESAIASIFTEVRYDVTATSSATSRQRNLHHQGALFVCYRNDHAPSLYVREARVKDHDDLTPIFNAKNTYLLDKYGEYFLAELIDAQDEDMQCLVGEANNSAVGFMSLSTEVNLELLNDCFELNAYNGLRKPSTSSEADLVIPEVAQVTEGVFLNLVDSQHGSLDNTHVASISSPEELSLMENESETSTITKSIIFSPDVGRQSYSPHPSNSESSSKRSSPIPSSEHRIEVPNLHWKEEETVPRYTGEQNCFAVQLFVIDAKHEMRSVDFLPNAFDLFPDLDFCVMSVPHLVPEFPLLQCGVRVTPRSRSTLMHELYVFSRDSLRHDFTVRKAKESDTDDINRLVEKVLNKELIIRDLDQFHRARRDNDGTELQAFVATIGRSSNEQVIGIAVTRHEEEIEYIRSHYNIEDFIYYNHHRRHDHAHLYHFLINPVFKIFSKHFLKEILRIGNKTCLYYPLFPIIKSMDYKEQHTLISSLTDLVPVNARRQIEYSSEVMRRNGPSKRIRESKMDPFALTHLNCKLALEPKVTINARIVVVGASTVGIAFLESFVFCPHLRFNNLTLISRHGLPDDYNYNPLCYKMLPTDHSYSQADFTTMTLRSWVNTITGDLVNIDRRRKKITVRSPDRSGDTYEVPYDHLILTTGLQFQMPILNNVEIITKDTELTDHRVYPIPPPENLFVVNDLYEAAKALAWLESSFIYQKRYDDDVTGLVKHRVVKREDMMHVVVYGRYLDAFTCVSMLLDVNVQPAFIHLVMPPLDEAGVTCFNDVEVEKMVFDELRRLGVNVYTDHEINEFIFSDTVYDTDEEDDLKQHLNGCSSRSNSLNILTNYIEGVTFKTADKNTSIACNAVFSYASKGVDHLAFQAINEACLVYDGRLVLDSNFHTNDVTIRAAGPCTKFRRAYHSENLTHDIFNSKELGIRLANSLLTLFDPTLIPETIPDSDKLKLIPLYKNPKIVGATLPGNMNYYHLEKPDIPLSISLRRTQLDYGEVMATGSATCDGSRAKPGYFMLHINQHKTIETITCLSRGEFSTSNYGCLYGLHEKFLKDMCHRYNVKLIVDFYKFFDQPDMMAIYHDRFSDFREEIRELLLCESPDGTLSIEGKIRDMLESDDSMLTDGQKKLLQTDYEQRGMKRAVEMRLLSFLNYNNYHLPMYAKPGMV